MEDLGRELREKLHQTKLDLMGSEGFYLLGYTRGKQVAFGGPYSSVELLRAGYRLRKTKQPRPQKWFAVEVRAIREESIG